MLLSYIIICISHKSTYFLLNGSAQCLLSTVCGTLHTSDSNSGRANIACINLYIQVKLFNKFCAIHHALSDIYVFYQFTYVEKLTLM